MRADCRGKIPSDKTAAYWPGMFMLYRSEPAGKIGRDYVQISIRFNERGQDIPVVDIHEPGWWTMGMSFTPDGQIHYYASEGVDDLTSDDYLGLSFPYNYKCLCMDNFFFNVANLDNGRTWSTPWVIDDPKIFVIPPQGLELADLYPKKGQRVPTFPITHVHDADKPDSFMGNLFGRSRRR